MNFNNHKTIHILLIFSLFSYLFERISMKCRYGTQASRARGDTLSVGDKKRNTSKMQTTTHATQSLAFICI